MIYYAEDDANIRELVVYTLGRSGLEARGCADAPAFFEACSHEIPDLALLDIMLPGQDGLSILKKMRADSRLSRIPVIMVTAKDSEYDTIIGLDSGADDYVTKPFSMMELVSRVRAVMRRCASKDAPDENAGLYECGSLFIDTYKHSVTFRGAELALTLKEFDLLSYLMENCGIVLTRQRLLEAVWGYEYAGETRTVDVHIRMLRQKLDDDADMIETVRGVGYRFTGERHAS